MSRTAIEATRPLQGIDRDGGIPGEQIAVGIGALGRDTIRPMHFGGHCLYVRKCKVGDQVGDNPNERMVDGIILPGIADERTTIVEVIAKGPKVGKPCSDKHAERFKRPTCVSDDVEIGDMLMVPIMHDGIMRSPLAEFEYFIEETVPICAVEGAEENEQSG